MASSTNRVIVVGALTGLGLVAALGAGNGGSVTPGPQGITVAAPLTKTGTLVGLMRCPAGQTPLPNANDAGYSCKDVIDSLSGSPTVSVGNLGNGTWAVSTSTEFCENPGDGFFYSIDNQDIRCIPDPSHGPLATSMSADAGLAVFSLSASHVEGETFGHVYTDAGIATNELSVGGGSVTGIYMATVTLSVGYSVPPNSAAYIGSKSVPGAVPGDFCAASIGEGGMYPVGFVPYCEIIYANSVSVSAMCLSGSECRGITDAGFYGTVKVMVVH